MFLMLFLNGRAQIGTNWDYDFSRRIHFGFTIGANYSRVQYDFSQNWYKQDTFTQVNSIGYPGFTLGAVANLHIGPKEGPFQYLREHMDLRAIPSLVLSQKRFNYKLKGTDLFVNKDIESAIVELPLLFKLKSDRFYDTRVYVIGGFKLSYDLSSDAKAARNASNPKIALYPMNYSYEYGIGLDQYYKFFKFSPEIKVSKGINNLYVPDPSIFGNIFSRFRTNFIYFSLYFEG